ncbi:UNVERIFIED_CONTAM: hypothetical protein OHV15_00840 [Microbacterium sp. SLM126]
MSAYDLFALHLTERETAHVDLERRRRVIERLAAVKASQSDTPEPVLVGGTGRRLGLGLGRVVLLRLRMRRV